MVSFRNIVAAAVVLAIPVISQSTPAEVVQNIRTLTAKSQNLQPLALSLTIFDGILFPIGQGKFPPIIAGFTDITSTATNALSQMQGMSAVPAGAPSDAIFDAFRDFVRVHQELLNILIGKAGLFRTVPLVGVPVANALRGIEGVVDSLAFALIDAVETRAADIQNQAGSLKMTIQQAIKDYEGLQLMKRAVPISRVKRAMVAAA